MDVKIYSSPTCPHCIAAKEFFKKNKIPDKDFSVEKPENAKKSVEVSGQTGVPVIVVDDKVIVGFDKEKLEKILK